LPVVVVVAATSVVAAARAACYRNPPIVLILGPHTPSLSVPVAAAQQIYKTGRRAVILRLPDLLRLAVDMVGSTATLAAAAALAAAADLETTARPDLADLALHRRVTLAAQETTQEAVITTTPVVAAVVRPRPAGTSSQIRVQAEAQAVPEQRTTSPGQVSHMPVAAVAAVR
jgi:hypothetical protein